MSDRSDPVRLREEDPWFREVFDHVRRGQPTAARVEALARAAERATPGHGPQLGAPKALAHWGTAMKLLAVVIVSSASWWALQWRPTRETRAMTHAHPPANVVEGPDEAPARAGSEPDVFPVPPPKAIQFEAARRSGAPREHKPAVRAASLTSLSSFKRKAVAAAASSSTAGKGPGSLERAWAPGAKTRSPAPSLRTARILPQSSSESVERTGERITLSELELLELAQRALRGAPERALDLAEQHGRDFPRGTYVQEREQIAIEALYALGRTQPMRARAERFRRAFPQSPHLRRIAGLAGTPPR